MIEVDNFGIVTHTFDIASSLQTNFYYKISNQFLEKQSLEKSFLEKQVFGKTVLFRKRIFVKYSSSLFGVDL